MTDATSAGQTGALPLTIRTVQMDLLEADPAQPRKHFNPAALAELGQSIAADGLLQPIVARPTQSGKLQIVAGERRWRAAKGAKLAELPVIIRPDLADKDVLVLQLVENLQREDLPPGDLAAGVAKLVEQIGGQATAERLKKSEAWVSTHCALIKLPEPVKAAVDDGVITSPDVAVALGRVYELDRSTANRRLHEYSEAAKGENSWTRAPTRAQIRSDLKDAEAKAERKAISDEAKKKEREKVAALKEKAKAGDKKAAAKVAEIAAAKADPEKAKNDLRTRCKSYRAKVGAFEKQMIEGLYKAAGMKAPQQQRYDSPIHLQSTFNGNEWNPSTPPADVESDQFHVQGRGSFQEVAKIAKVLQAEPKLSLQDIDSSITMAEAKKIAAILGDRAHFSFDEKRSGKKLRAIVDPTTPAAARKATPAPAGDDPFGVRRFLAARTAKATPAHRVAAADLHAAYATFAKADPDVDQPLKRDDNRWSAELKRAGLTSIRSNGIKWQGIKLVEVKS